MPEDLLTLSTGVSNAKLESANAVAGDVKSGKTFYAGDKTLKAGTLTLSGNAAVGNVLSGKTFYSNSWTKQTGTMTNRGAWNSTINAGASVTIPAGYHSGSGKVTARAETSNIALAGLYSSSSLTGWATNTIFVTDVHASFISNYSKTDDFTVKYTVSTAGNYRFVIRTSQGWLCSAKVTVGNTVLVDSNGADYDGNNRYIDKTITVSANQNIIIHAERSTYEDIRMTLIWLWARKL